MTAGLSHAILKLNQKDSLSSDEMTAAMEWVVSGHAQDEEIEKFLLSLREKGETVEEIVAAVRVMRKSRPVLRKVTGMGE